MGYSVYKKLKVVSKKFNLDVKSVRLFRNIAPVEPSSWLLETLDAVDFLPITNEKAKSERLVSPVLTEIAKAYRTQISLFSGEDISVRPEDDLSGPCDFFFALHPPKPFIDAPIISLTEAKDEDMEWGLAQCLAQMYGAKLYNEAEGKPVKVIYGCATTGTDWQFLRMEDSEVLIDNKILTDLRELLGTWHHVIQFYLS